MSELCQIEKYTYNFEKYDFFFQNHHLVIHFLRKLDFKKLFSITHTHENKETMVKQIVRNESSEFLSTLMCDIQSSQTHYKINTGQ